MSVVLKHLETLKNYIPPSFLEGVNKLYFLEVVEKPNLVKVGDTHRLVETRNDETLINASLHRSKPVTWVVAQNHDGTSFRDKSFHKHLEKAGYERELNDNKTKSEWFFITLDQALLEFEKFTSKPVYKTAQLYPAQHYILERLQEAHNQGQQYINAGLCMRVGKTIISLTDASINQWMPVYLGKNLTSQSSAESDNKQYNIVPEMLTQSLHGIDEITAGDLSKLAKKIVAAIDKANIHNKAIIFFIDEVDDSSHTELSRAIITQVVEHYKKNGKFACIITMSGTRIYRGEKILKELTDGPIKEISLEYYEMQILQPETTCRRNYRHISFYTEKTNLVNISQAMKNMTVGHKSLATCIEKLLGTNGFEFTGNNNFPHWFMKFSTIGKSNANALVRYLNRNCFVIENKQYHFESINGDVTTASEAQEFCKNIIKQKSDKTCVFISQGMATTSFSITEIGNSAVFTDNELTADDTQALHRSATWTVGKDECNMIVITTNDSKEYSFDDIFEDETKIATTANDRKEIYKEILNNNSMIHFHEAHGFSPVVITKDNVDNVIDKKMQAMTKVASIMNVLNDLDEEILENILSNVVGKKGTSKSSKTSKPDAFDPFGVDNKKTTIKPNIRDSNSSKKEAILRAFVENAINVPAIAREQEVTIDKFEFWDELGFSKELFFDVYNSSWIFKERIDTIYNLCYDNEYLINNYIDKLTV